MKKIITAILCLILCLSLCACGNQGSQSEQKENTQLESSVVEFNLDSVHGLNTPDGCLYQNVDLTTEEVLSQEGISYEDVQYEPVWAKFKSEEMMDCLRDEGVYYITSSFENENGEAGNALYVCDFKNGKLIMAQTNINDIADAYIYVYS